MSSSCADVGRRWLKLAAALLAFGVADGFCATVASARDAKMAGDPSRSMTRLGAPLPQSRTQWRSAGKAAHAPRLATATTAHRVSSEKAQVATSRATREAAAPLIAIVSLSSQRMQVYDGTGRIAETRVSTGMAGHRTPAGIYAVLQKSRHHRSNIYDGAPMPWMHRLTWSGIAIHAGVVPNRPASHGCIRVPYEFAPRLWSMSRIGMRVIVAHDDLKPVPIEHATLPTPTLTPVPIAETLVSRRTASAEVGTLPANEEVLLAPLDFAHVRRSRAQASVRAAETDASAARERASETAAAATRASEQLRARWAAIEALEGRLDRLRAEIEAAADDARGDELRSEAAEIERVLAGARTAHSDTRPVEQAASDAAFAAVRDLRSTEVRLLEATAALEASKPTTEPVTILVSRAEGRVTVRQAFGALHEEPITIRDPEKPIGTHVFTAMQDGNGGSSLRWSVITVASPRLGQDDVERSPQGTRSGSAMAKLDPHQPAGPAEALERIELPRAARELISARLWLGATLILSDAPTSRETGKTTDIIVQPKGD